MVAKEGLLESATPCSECGDEGEETGLLLHLYGYEAEDNRVEFTCVGCGHVWFEGLRQKQWPVVIRHYGLEQERPETEVEAKA